MADTDNALLDVGDAVEYLGAPQSEYGTVSSLVDIVSHRFNAETGRKLKARDYTELYDGNGKMELYLNNWPLASTTITITINSNRDFTSTGDRVTSTDVMLSTESGRVRLDGEYFDLGEHNVQVAYTAGYTTSDAHDLTYAAKEFLQILWDRHTARESIAVRTEAYEGVSRTYEAEFPWTVYKTLAMYREGRAY